MSQNDKSFRVDYVYGPFVGRRQITGPTLNDAVDKLWQEMAKSMWVAKRFRTVKELKE